MNLKSPYAHLDSEDEMTKVQFQISTADRNLIKTLIPDHGFITYLGASFFKTICNDFRRVGLTTYDPDPEHEQKILAVINSRFGIRSEAVNVVNPVAEVDQSTAGRNESSRKGGRNQTPPRPAKQSANPTPASRVRRGSRGRGPQAEVQGEVSGE